MDEDRIAPLFAGRHILLTGGDCLEAVKCLNSILAVFYRYWVYGKSFG